MKSSLLTRLTRRLFLASALVAPSLSLLSQTPIESLEPLVISATRTPNSPETLGTVVDFISPVELARRQISSLKEALGDAASPVFSPGAAGANTSIFLRGSNSNQTLFLVDGIRFNDPNTDYSIFLGGAGIAGSDSLEIVHGPQSTLYGGEAIGGVVSLRALRGEGVPTASVSMQAGSFGTVQGALAAQGERSGWGYNFSAQGGHTDNQRVNNEFDSLNATLRLDRKLNERVTAGGTVRWFHGVYGSPGDRFTNDPDNQDREDNLLVTAFAEFKPSEAWESRATLGAQNRRFVSEDIQPPFPKDVTIVTNRRAVLDWQTTYRGFEHHRITGGVTAEANTTRNTGFGNIDQRQTLLAFFAQDEFNPVENVYLTGGLRRDDFNTFGHATTGRATAAWLIAPKTIKLRASYGTGFRSPGFLDLYGQSSFYVGNPRLRPEHARGWDAGVDVYLPQKRGTLSATWFQTDYRDLIVFDFGVFPGTTANVEQARTRGLELSFQTTLPGAIELRLAYNYLEADNLTQHTRLLRRPRHNANVDLWHDFGRGVSVGVGVKVVAQREDIDAFTFATIDEEDFTVVRIYAAWAVTSRLTLKARLENLLNEKYEEVNGYPQLGFGAFAGAEWKF